MRIAQIAPLIESVPPKKYGGTERVVSALTEALVNRGHQVTLFASGDSQTTANLQAIYPRAIRTAKLLDIHGINYWTMVNIGYAYERFQEFDVIHDHNGHLGIPLASKLPIPVVITFHGSFKKVNRHIFDDLNPSVHLVSISKSQRQSMPHLPWAGTVYNGLGLKKFPFSAKPRGFLLFVGRFAKVKGAHQAIKVARELNLPLILAAKLDTRDMGYFQKHIGPYLSDQIRWVGEIGQIERNRYMSKALCLLHPCSWSEPFGLTLIEAMACGCPVVAFRHGSIPEVVKNRQTGYIVSSVEGMIKAVTKISTIGRQICRDYALTQFNDQVMADAYEAIYRRVVKTQG